MDSYKPRNLFDSSDQAALLEAMRAARRHVQRLCSVISADSERYKRCEEAISAMEDLAGDLTGDKTLFYGKH
jgi:hypothetical protein